MRYREYRRECEAKKDKRLAAIADFKGGYPAPVLKMKVLDTGKRTCWFDGEHDYVKRIYRGKKSSGLKKLYARNFRRGKNKMEMFTGCEYRKVSGDFWWEIA